MAGRKGALPSSRGQGMKGCRVQGVTEEVAWKGHGGLRVIGKGRGRVTWA